MEGPLLLGIVGAAVVLVATFLSWLLVTPRRYRRIEAVGALRSGAGRDFVRLFTVQGRLVLATCLGSALQLGALLWQASRSS